MAEFQQLVVLDLFERTDTTKKLEGGAGMKEWPLHGVMVTSVC